MILYMKKNMIIMGQTNALVQQNKGFLTFPQIKENNSQ